MNYAKETEAARQRIAKSMWHRIVRWYVLNRIRASVKRGRFGRDFPFISRTHLSLIENSDSQLTYTGPHPNRMIW